MKLVVILALFSHALAFAPGAPVRMTAGARGSTARPALLQTDDALSSRRTFFSTTAAAAAAAALTAPTAARAADATVAACPAAANK